MFLVGSKPTTMTRSTSKRFRIKNTELGHFVFVSFCLFSVIECSVNREGTQCVCLCLCVCVCARSYASLLLSLFSFCLIFLFSFFHNLSSPHTYILASSHTPLILWLNYKSFLLWICPRFCHRFFILLSAHSLFHLSLPPWPPLLDFWIPPFFLGDLPIFPCSSQ